MGLDTYGTDEPRVRLSLFLRQRYRRDHRVKRLASDLGCTEKAADNMLASHWPNSRLWAAIVRRFGRDVVDAVFGPEIDETTSRLESEVRELERQLEEKRCHLRQAQGPLAGDPRGVAAPAPRPVTAQLRPIHRSRSGST